jgi:hypothetical protein
MLERSAHGFLLGKLDQTRIAEAAKMVAGVDMPFLFGGLLRCVGKPLNFLKETA